MTRCLFRRHCASVLIFAELEKKNFFLTSVPQGFITMTWEKCNGYLDELYDSMNSLFYGDRSVVRGSNIYMYIYVYTNGRMCQWRISSCLRSLFSLLPFNLLILRECINVDTMCKLDKVYNCETSIESVELWLQNFQRSRLFQFGINLPRCSLKLRFRKTKWAFTADPLTVWKK